MLKTYQINTRTVLPTIDEAQPLSSKDDIFVKELYTLLEKHDNQNRFGLTLLHEHFSVEDNEVLLESNNPKERSLSLNVVKRSELVNDKATSWSFSKMADDSIFSKSITTCAGDEEVHK